MPVGLYLKDFKIIEYNKQTKQDEEKDGIAFFEASPAAKMYCKANGIVLQPAAAPPSSGTYVRRTYWTRTSDGEGTFTSKKQTKDKTIRYDRAQKPPVKRGKIITFRTGLYLNKPTQGAWLPKTFSFRYPAWLNNAFALDFAAEFFGSKVSDAPQGFVDLFGSVLLGEIPYLIPSKTSATSTPAKEGEARSIKDKQDAASGLQPASTENK